MKSKKSDTYCNLLLLSTGIILGLCQFSDAAANGVPSVTVATVGHTVMPGDSLYKIASTYLGDPSKWKQISSFNHIKNHRHLPIGTEIRIPSENAYATVIFVHGDAFVFSPQSPQTAKIDVGNKIYEGGKVIVSENSFVSLQFTDKSIVRLSPNTTFILRKIRVADTNAKNLKSMRAIELERGHVDISVTPYSTSSVQKNKKSHTFEVSTPMAVAAVRGTRFDVNMSALGLASGVTQGIVDIRQNHHSKNNQQAVLNAGSGITVDVKGNFGAVRPLLPAPNLTKMLAQYGNLDDASLEWEDINGAVAYQVRVASNANMENVFLSQNTTKPNLPLQALKDGTYEVGIRGLDAEGIMGFESVKTIQVHSHPASPFYLQPELHQTIGKNSILKCTEVVGAKFYHLQVSTSKDFQILTLDAPRLSSCNQALSNLSHGSYYWRVASIVTSEEGTEVHGPYSEPSHFQVDESFAAREEKNIRSAYWVTEKSNLWISQISTDPTFNSNTKEITLMNPNIKFDGLQNGNYYIRVKAKSADGDVRAFSPARKVEIKTSEQTMERTWADKPK